MNTTTKAAHTPTSDTPIVDANETFRDFRGVDYGYVDSETARDLERSKNGYNALCLKLDAENTKLTADRDALVKALEFYAKAENYEPIRSAVIVLAPAVKADGGAKARAALAQAKGE